MNAKLTVVNNFLVQLSILVFKYLFWSSVTVKVVIKEKFVIVNKLPHVEVKYIFFRRRYVKSDWWFLPAELVFGVQSVGVLACLVCVVCAGGAGYFYSTLRTTHR